MKVQLDTQNFDLNKKQEHALNKKLQKLDRFCKMFKSDLVDVHMHMDLKKPPEGFVTKLTLSVPNRQMAAETKNKKFILSIGEAFNKVMAQLRKYKGQLKNEKAFAEVAMKKGKA